VAHVETLYLVMLLPRGLLIRTRAVQCVTNYFSLLLLFRAFEIIIIFFCHL